MTLPQIFFAFYIFILCVACLSKPLLKGIVSAQNRNYSRNDEDILARIIIIAIVWPILLAGMLLICPFVGIYQCLFTFGKWIS